MTLAFDLSLSLSPLSRLIFLYISVSVVAFVFNISIIFSSPPLHPDDYLSQFRLYLALLSSSLSSYYLYIVPSSLSLSRLFAVLFLTICLFALSLSLSPIPHDFLNGGVFA